MPYILILLCWYYAYFWGKKSLNLHQSYNDAHIKNYIQIINITCCQFSVESIYLNSFAYFASNVCFLYFYIINHRCCFNIFIINVKYYVIKDIQFKSFKIHKHSHLENFFDRIFPVFIINFLYISDEFQKLVWYT